MVAIYEETGTQRTLILRAISDYGDERKKEVDAVEEGALQRFCIYTQGISTPDQGGEAAPTEDVLQRAGKAGVL